jgi:peptide-methionine (S)-S-oxide reductase
MTRRLRPRRARLSAAFLAALLGTSPPPASAQATPPTHPEDEGPALVTVVFSGGCFWGVQGVFEHVRGVVDATSGYAGGEAGTASYDRVETGSTGQAESVEVRFDPSQVTFDQLLQVFFEVAHDPTEVDHQGPDYGPQYRSAIWTTTDEQERAARAYITHLTEAGAFADPITTTVGPLRGFYPAETYHQDYFIHHLRELYIVINDLPKVERLRRDLPSLWRDEPATWRRDPANPR